MYPSFFKNLGQLKISEIKKLINCRVLNIDDNEEFYDLVSTNDIKENSITFSYDNENIENLKNTETQNFAIICSEKKAEKLSASYKLLIVKDVHDAVAISSTFFYRDLNKKEIEELNDPFIGANPSISKYSHIDKGVFIGDNVTIDDGAIIKHGCVIGNGTKIESNSVISNSIIGENVRVGPNTSIGQQGFGFSINKNKNKNIFHIGRTILKKNSSIGSNCTIDRGSFSDTIIGENTFFDNQCHVAHNVQIGRNCVFAGMTGIAGSTIIGNGVLTGGQVGISGHLKIGNNVQIAAKSAVYQNISDNEVIMGIPAVNKFKFLKNVKKTYG